MNPLQLNWSAAIIPCTAKKETWKMIFDIMCLIVIVIGNNNEIRAVERTKMAFAI